MNVEPTLSMVVAFTNRQVLGNNNSIPWHLPEDLQHFRKITEHGVVIMGRKTFESLPNGPLKNRMNVVITRQPMKHHRTLETENENLRFVTMESVETIISEYQQQQRPIFIIGGSEIYSLFFDYCKTIYIAHVLDDTIEGDVHFPYDVQYFCDNSAYDTLDIGEVMFSKHNNLAYQYYTFVRKYT